MHDQRIGHDRNDLVKQVQGEQASGQGSAQTRAYRYGVADIKAGLGMFVQCPHIADAVESGEYPQAGGDTGKDQTQAVQVELEGNPRIDGGQGAVIGSAMQNVRKEREHNEKSDHRTAYAATIAQIGPLASCQHDQQTGDDRYEWGGYEVDGIEGVHALRLFFGDSVQCFKSCTSAGSMLRNRL